MYLYRFLNTASRPRFMEKTSKSYAKVIKQLCKNKSKFMQKMFKLCKL